MFLCPQIKTLEENPKKFLDTEIIRKNNNISTQVITALTKFPVHWSSKITTNYKSNAIAKKKKKESHKL